jgi:hypothetical protein
VTRLPLLRRVRPHVAEPLPVRTAAAVPAVLAPDRPSRAPRRELYAPPFPSEPSPRWPAGEWSVETLAALSDDRPDAPVAARSGAPAVDRASVRAWARQHGLPVSDRGRLPGRLVEAYAAAH